MVVDNTVYCDEGGVRKQLTMDGWAAQALTTANNLTKGVVAHECLLLANPEYTDDLSDVEQRVFNDAPGIVEALDELVSARISGAKTALADDCDYDDPHERVDADLYLMSSLVDDLPQRYVGDLIAESVAYVVASPWSSRFDRLADVQDLSQYRETGETPEDASDFVDAVVAGQSQKWDVDDLHELVDSETDWWELDSITPVELMDRGEDIPKTVSQRLPAVKRAWASIDDIEYEAAREGLEGFFTDYSSDDPIDSMLDELVESGHVSPSNDKGKDSSSTISW